MRSTPLSLTTLKHRLAPSRWGWHVGFLSDCKSSRQDIRICSCCKWQSMSNDCKGTQPLRRFGVAKVFSQALARLQSQSERLTQQQVSQALSCDYQVHHATSPLLRSGQTKIAQTQFPFFPSPPLVRIMKPNIMRLLKD